MQKCGDGVGAKLGGVETGGRQAAERARDVIGRDGAGFGRRLTRQQIRQNRTRRDGRDAALRLEPSGADAAVFEANRKSQDIAADRIGDFDRGRGVRQVSGVVRVLEVIEERLTEHPKQYRAARPALHAAW